MMNYIRLCLGCEQFFTTSVGVDSLYCQNCNNTIKGKEIIKHFLFTRELLEENRERYLCNWAVKPKDEKLTKNIKEVNCKNCLQIIKNWELQKIND